MTDVDARRRELQAFVQEHSTLDKDGLLALIEEGHRLLVSSISSLSPAQAAWKPAPNEWSALEAMSHIIEVKEGVTKTCVALAAGERPPSVEEALLAEWLAKGYSGEPLATPALAVEAARAAHGDMASFVNSISDRTDRTATHDHPLVGPMNCIGWAVFQRAHDADHGAQIESVRGAQVSRGRGGRWRART